MNIGKSPTTRVIVVDDEPLIRWSLSEILTREGYQVLEAHNAARTLEHVGADPRHEGIVLLDLRLPDCRDLTLLKQLRKLAPSWRVILMTAYGTPELAEEAVDLGASQVLSKPFDIHAIIGVVEQALARPLV